MAATTTNQEKKKKNQAAGKIENFSYGDQVKVHFRIREGESERVQVFEGIVIRKRGSGDSKTFTVRKTSFGVGVERIFPLKSPLIEKIEVVKPGRVRRAKLYYLRKLAGKAARITREESADQATGEEGAQTTSVESPTNTDATSSHTGEDKTPTASSAPTTSEK